MSFTPEDVKTIVDFVKRNIEGSELPGRDLCPALKKFWDFNDRYFGSLDEKLAPPEKNSERLLSIINCKSDLTS